MNSLSITMGMFQERGLGFKMRGQTLIGKINRSNNALGNVLLGVIIGSVFSISFYVLIQKWEWEDLDIWAVRMSVVLLIVFFLYILLWAFRRELLNKVFGVSHNSVTEALSSVSNGLKENDVSLIVNGIRDSFVIWSAVRLRWVLPTIVILLMGNILLVTNAAMLVKQTKVLTEELDRKKSISMFDIDEKLALGKDAIQISAYLLLPNQRNEIGLPGDPIKINNYLYWLDRLGTYYRLNLIEKGELEISYGVLMRALFKTPKFCEFIRGNIILNEESMRGLVTLGDELAKQEKKECINT